MGLTVQGLSADRHRAWDTYVAGHPLGTPFHLTAWKRVIEETFHYSPRYLAAADDAGAIHGVLPLFAIDGFLTGRVLISSPFAVYGGILASSPEAHQLLSAELRRLAINDQVQYADLRNAWPEQASALPQIDRYVTFTLPVKPCSDDELLASLPKKTRNMVRKAQRTAYSTRQAASIGEFYRLLSLNYRRLGTPVFPAAFFERILQYFRPLADLREIVCDGRVAAAALNFTFRGSMHTYYAASDQSMLDQAPNHYMYFDFLRSAASAGCTEFDFGRSKKDTGTFEFKRHWGALCRELPYEILLVQRKDLPNFSPKNPKFDLAIKAWQRLPLSVTNLLGPRLIGLFP